MTMSKTGIKGSCILKGEFEENFEKAKKLKGGLVYSYFTDLLKKDTLLKDIPYLKKQNTKSFAFTDCVARVFGLQSKEFCTAFHEVTTGEGAEKDKISTIHSSSLLGLLAFYKMKFDNQRMRIKLGDTNFCFDRVVFERTNPVFSKSVGLSSIDIALYGTANGKPAVLYLESKFSEYLERKESKSPDKNKQYQVYYEALSNFIGEDNSGKEITFKYEDGKLIVSSSKPHYCEGIKQMISHYIGALNSDDRKDYDIYIGSILFDFENTELKCSKDFKNEGHYSDYCSIYQKLVQEFKRSKEKFENIEPPKFIKRDSSHSVTILPKIISYKDFFDQVELYELDDVVKKYYCL